MARAKPATTSNTMAILAIASISGLAGLAILGALASLGLAIHGAANRAEPLPEVPQHRVHHDGVYPAATQELTQTITIDVPGRHLSPTSAAIVRDIEIHGGRVTEHNRQRIEALAPRQYIERIERLKPVDSRAHFNTQYRDWVEESVTLDADDLANRPAGEWTAFSIRIDPRYTPNQASEHAVTAALLVTLACGITAMVGGAAWLDSRAGRWPATQG